MYKLISSILVMGVVAGSAVAATPIEPRSLTWHIVSDREMARICTKNGLRPNCEGMAAWDSQFRMCIIWTRSPRNANDLASWQVVHHELQHCQQGHFHR